MIQEAKISLDRYEIDKDSLTNLLFEGKDPIFTRSLDKPHKDGGFTSRFVGGGKRKYQKMNLVSVKKLMNLDRIQINESLVRSEFGLESTVESTVARKKSTLAKRIIVDGNDSHSTANLFVFICVIKAPGLR
jgi:hypothetical protein